MRRARRRPRGARRRGPRSRRSGPRARIRCAPGRPRTDRRWEAGARRGAAAARCAPVAARRRGSRPRRTPSRRTPPTAPWALDDRRAPIAHAERDRSEQRLVGEAQHLRAVRAVVDAALAAEPPIRNSIELGLTVRAPRELLTLD